VKTLQIRAALVVAAASAALSLGCATASSSRAAPAEAPKSVLSANDPKAATAPPSAGAAAAAAPAEVPPLPGEEILNNAPALAPLADFAAPVPSVKTLKNGLRIYLVNKPGAAIETIALVLKQGATSDPQGHAGLASLAATMLEAGAGGKSQAEIAAAADALGATLHTAAATDATFVSISGLPEHLARMVPLLADVALRPTLDAGEWAKVQSTRVAELQAALAEPRVAAGLAFASALYGNAPLGHPALGTPASVQATTLADVKGFLASQSPKESALIVVGSAPDKAVLAALQPAFEKWSEAPAAKKARAARAKELAAQKSLTPAKAPRFVFVEFPGRPQTVMRVGQAAVPRSSPDVLALRLLNSVLGGSFTSRLNQNLREQHGYTYGAGSNFAFGRGPGPFAAASSVKTNVTGLALAETLKELARATAEPLSEGELQKGKALLAYQLVETLQHADGTAAALAEIFIDDLPNDEYATFVPRLRALTAPAVQEAARRTLHPEQMTVVLAGDRAQVLPQLQEAGVVLPAPEERNALGEQVSAGAPKP